MREVAFPYKMGSHIQMQRQPQPETLAPVNRGRRGRGRGGSDAGRGPSPAVRKDRNRTRDMFVRFAHAVHEGNEVVAAQLRAELVAAHMNLVRYLAAKFKHRGEPFDDLVQVGALGLLKAIDRFSIERGVEFATYATPTIVGEIKRYFRDKCWAMKVPRRLQELYISINRAVEHLSVQSGRAPTVAELAAHLKATEEEILESQELGHAYNLVSIDLEIGGEDDKKSSSLGSRLGSTDGALALFEDRRCIERALQALSGRERVIVYLRFFEGISQAEIGRRLGVSQMHVSRLQDRALHNLRVALQGC